MPGAVDRVVCAPDDGWIYYTKNVEVFPEINKLVTLYVVGYRCNDCYWVHFNNILYFQRQPYTQILLLTSALHRNYTVSCRSRCEC